MKRWKNDDRGRIHLPDMFLAAAVFAGAIAVSPIITDLTSGMTADPLTQLILTLLVPALLIGIVVSLGVSAVRND